MAPNVLYENYNMGPSQHQRRSPKRACDSAGFTMVETIVAIAVLGLGVATTIGALTKMNAIAATSRNSTGAYTILTNQVDLFQSMSPFNPQKTNSDGTVQIPKDSSHGSYPTYDMTAGTHNISVNGTDFKVPVYQYKDASGNVVLVVNGTLTTTVTDLSSSLPNTYQAVFTLTYTYLNRNYTYSMSTIRTSDI
ncbi:MAG TPA: prepilin-type N-terminal cleavage/methylation domain-containing protein [Chthoniobacterales bacterium]|jgi:prepilin-type N-terminal cleavage/methylation domain-containing protein|nr:prepilin-type N-terminal cleavage/methylation domain-containing protein [Chthoniobacterales bacterium]